MPHIILDGVINMRLMLCSLTVSLFSISVSAETIWVGDACSYFGEQSPQQVQSFAPQGAAIDVLDRILEIQGLERNFTISSANVPNAMATVRNSERLILYNPDFLRFMGDRTGNAWAGISLLAHEVGHHLNGHTLEGGGSRPPTELEADRFSGFVLQKMGATLEDATIAMAYFGSERGTNTHPGRDQRLAAITDGWNRACRQDPQCQVGQISQQSQGQWTDQCIVYGEVVRVDGSDRVISMDRNIQVGEKVSSRWPNDCVFDLTNRDGYHYCVEDTGAVLDLDNDVVGECWPM